jgi:RNA polymerase sigma-70 factor (ECF subfamily)
VGESAPDDVALARRTLAGDRAAFDDLVRRHQKSVYGIAYGILRSASDAEDAAQDVFLRAFRYLPSFDPSRSFEGWLMAIAVNQARGLRSSRRGETARVDPTSFAAGRPPEGNPELREAALRAIDGLPERQRDAMLLFLNSELTLDQIGDALGCSKGTVGAHLHRARAALKKALGRWVS